VKDKGDVTPDEVSAGGSKKPKKKTPETAVGKFKQDQADAKEAITSKYSKEVREFYALSKEQQKAYAEANPDSANKLYAEARKLDNELTGNKFRKTAKYAPAKGEEGQKLRLRRSHGFHL
jgi:hypothetical protein